MAAAIDISNLTKTYRPAKGKQCPAQILTEFTLAVEKGQFVVLYGPNGCGKTTLIHIAAGVEKYDSGNALILGKKPEEVDIGIVFQNYSATLFPWLNLIDNISFPLTGSGVNRKKAVRELLEDLQFQQIQDLLESHPYKLSGGQQQMVAIGRALIARPPVVFFDEAFSALDGEHKDKALKGVQRFCQCGGTTCLFAIHDVDEAILLADRLLILDSNPLRIKEDLAVEFDRPRNLELLRREEFSKVRNRVLQTTQGRA